MDMNDKVDRQKEGLRSLAHLMATAYRNGKTFRGVEEPVVSDDKVIGKVEYDPETNSYLYTETVSTDLLRRKSRHNSV